MVVYSVYLPIFFGPRTGTPSVCGVRFPGGFITACCLIAVPLALVGVLFAEPLFYAPARPFLCGGRGLFSSFGGGVAVLMFSNVLNVCVSLRLK